MNRGSGADQYPDESADNEYGERQPPPNVTKRQSGYVGLWEILITLLLKEEALYKMIDESMNCIGSSFLLVEKRRISMKKLVVCILAVMLLGACGTKSSSGKLRVGMECDYAPFNWTQLNDSDTAVLIDGGQAGYCDGYDVAIARAIASDLGMELVIKKIEWDGLPMAVNNDEIDLIIAGMTDTEERRASLTFTTPYYVSDMVLIVRADSQWVDAESIQDFSRAKVVAQLNTFHDDIIEQIKGVIHETPMGTFPLMTVALQSGAVDAMVSELPVAIAITNTNTDLVYVQFDPDQGFEAGEDATVSIALKIGSPLFDSVQAALNKITEAQRIDMMTEALGRAEE